MNMALANKSKILAGLILVILIILGLYFFTRPTDKPKCNCIFPNTGEYGVIKDGECVVMDCKRDSQNK